MMPIPDFQSFLLPFLEFSAKGKDHTLQEAREALVKPLNVTEEDRRKLLPSGRQTIYDNRVSWARVYLTKAGLLESKQRGHFHITEEGKALLKKEKSRITIKYLKENYPSFLAFSVSNADEEKALKNVKVKSAVSDSEAAAEEPATPSEELERAYETLKTKWTSDLMEQVRSCAPSFFEKLVVDLLVKMGYGGSRNDVKKAAQIVGGPGDGGIDGVINEDKLGLEKIYIQAKRWNETTINERTLRDFVGALEGRNANKGVFITTAECSTGAEKYLSDIKKNVVFIGGKRLFELMNDFNVGLSKKATFRIKQVDLDYFQPEEGD